MATGSRSLSSRSVWVAPQSVRRDVRPDLRVRSGFNVRKQGGAMSEQNVEWVKGVYGAFSRGDIPAVLEAFSDDVEWFEAEGMPYGGLYRSGEAVLQNVFGPIAADVESFAVTPEEYIGSGATVAAIVRYTGT